MRGNLTIFKKGVVLVAVPFLFQLAFVGLVAVMVAEDEEAGGWSFHTKEVLRQAQAVLTRLVDAETGSRGFMLTGDPVFTEPFDRARQEVPASLLQLETLVGDNPEQEARVRELAVKAQKVIDWHATSINLVRQGKPEQAVTLAKTLKGKEQMDEIRQDMNAFLAEEQRLDQEREQIYKRLQQRFFWVLVGGAAVSLLSTVAMTFVFNRGISGRLATLTNNAQRLADGKDLAPPLGGSDEITYVDRAFHTMAAELARSTQAMRDQSRLLQSVLDNMGDGVVVADQNGKFLIFNPAAERILGFGAIDTIPAAWTERYGVYLPDQVTAFPPDRLPLVRAMKGEIVDADEQFVRNAHVPAGVWLSVSARPLMDASQGSLGGVVVFRDVSVLKRKEEEVRKLNEELEQRVVERTADLAEANRDLEQKNQENEMFVYSVSHDLRAPLVNLQGFGEELGMVCQDLRALLADDAVPPVVRDRGLALLDGDVAESTRFIQTGVLRLSGIIDALLRLSRAGRVEYRWQRVEVNAVVARVVESLNGTITQRGATVRMRNLPPVWGDPTAVEQIFANLIGNALNYLDSKRPGVIEVGGENRTGGSATGADSAFHTYYVKDNGLGIPESYRPKIFQAFQRLHPQVAKGEGIGLVMVRRMVERHGGKIWLESAQGAGSTFFVTLPSSGVNGNGGESKLNGVCVSERE
jgi:signal transduction histidine kinase/CHASE3 domain sensor protein